MNNEPTIAESGVAFPDETTAEIFVEASFIESGNQLQMALIGTEPVLLIQPEYDADENEVKFIVTAVDLDPQGLVDVLELLLDSARTMAEQQDEMIAAADEAELEAVREPYSHDCPTGCGGQHGA